MKEFIKHLYVSPTARLYCFETTDAVVMSACEVLADDIDWDEDEWCK